MTSLKAYQEFLETRGVSLEPLGVAEFAVRRADALRAVELLESEGRAVLGGDVYVADGQSIESDYANWYLDRLPTELREDFVARSCAKSRSYISSYPDPPRGQALFVLVVE